MSSNRLAGPALALALCLGALMAPAQGYAAQTPDEVLAEETATLRDLASDDPEFVGRMDQYAAYAEALRDMSTLVEEYRPLLDDLSQLQNLAQLGLLDVLTQMEPDLAFVGPLLETLVTARDLVDQLDAFGRGMTVLSADMNQLMTAPTLTLGQIQALRGSIPAGVAAIQDAARAYARVRPALDEASSRLQLVRTQLAVTLDVLLQGMMPTDLTQQLKVSMDGIFDEMLAVKAGLDTLADHADADAAVLRRLEGALIEAEAHHAYALAEAMLQADEVAQAEQAMRLLIEMYPGSRWAAEAQLRLERGLAAELTASSGRSARTGLLWLVLAVTVAVAAGFVAWSIRRERTEKGAGGES